MKQRQSRITTVYLEELNDIKQIDFLYTLCPDMMNFMVKFMFGINFQTFLQTVLIKNTHHGKHYRHSFCF